MPGLENILSLCCSFAICACQVKDTERIRAEVHRGMKALGSALYTVQTRMDRSQVVRLTTVPMCHDVDPHLACKALYINFL